VQVWVVPVCWNKVEGVLNIVTTEFISMLSDMVNKCCAVLKMDSRVTSIYLIGSLSRGDADVNSDVDLCILVSKENHDSIIKDADNIAAVVGPVLASGWICDSTCYSALYDVSGKIVKVDYDYYSMKNLPDLIALSMSTMTYLFDRKLLYDCFGKVEDMFKAIKSSQVQAISHQSHTPFSISAWSVVRMVRRGELLEALDIMNHMRDPIITRLLCQIYNVPFENYRRMETKLPDEILPWLKRTIARPTRDALLTALRELVGLYLYASNLLGNSIGKQEFIACDRIIKESVQPFSIAKSNDSRLDSLNTDSNEKRGLQ